MLFLENLSTRPTHHLATDGNSVPKRVSHLTCQAHYHSMQVVAFHGIKVPLRKLELSPTARCIR